MNTEQTYDIQVKEPIAKEATPSQRKARQSNIESAILTLLQKGKTPSATATVPFNVTININVITHVHQQGTGNCMNIGSKNSIIKSKVSSRPRRNKRELQLEAENTALRNQLASLQQSLNLQISDQ